MKIFIAIFGIALGSIALHAAVTVTFPNSNVYTSPYSCMILSGVLYSPLGGCYIKGVVSNTTTISVNVDTSINSGQSANNMPSFRVTIDDVSSSYIQEGTTDTNTVLATGLSTASHKYLIQIIGAYQLVGNSWTGQTGWTKINSIQFDTGATLSAPVIRPNVCLFYGDSYLETDLGLPETGPIYTWADYTVSYPRWISSALNCEYGQIGIGSQGWVHGGNGGYPGFTSTWDHYDSTHSRDLSITPQYLIVAQGNNDHVGTVPTSSLNSAINSFLTALRSTWPTVNTFILTPFADVNDVTNHNQIATSVNNYAIANSDLRLFSIDIGTEYQLCLPFSSGATWCSADGFHPAKEYHGAIGAMVLNKMLTVLPVGGMVRLRGQVNVR
jgi:hypothetical protein